MNWTQYQQMTERFNARIDRLANKYSHNPNHKNAKEWKQIILDSNLYSEQDLEYLVGIYSTLKGN